MKHMCTMNRWWGWCVVLILFWSSIGSMALAKPPTFKLEPMNVLECEGQAKFRLLMGVPAPVCSKVPNKLVKAYPALKSKSPFYGFAIFEASPFDIDKGIRLDFVIDESRGTGKGYDTLYLDLNHDKDLTNDLLLKKDTSPPKEGFRANDVVFETFSMVFDTGNGSFKQQIYPRFQAYQDSAHVFFVPRTVQKGKITFDSKESEIILMTIGRYNQPWVNCVLDNQQAGLGLLGEWRLVDNALHYFQANADGSEVSIHQYQGASGNLALALASEAAGPVKVEMGWLMGEDRMIDIMKCPKQEGVPQIPVGDYRIIRVAASCDKVRFGLGLLPPDEESFEIPNCEPITIVADQTTTMALDADLKAIFKWTNEKKTFKPGETIKVEAAFGYADKGLCIAGLEDMSKEKGSFDLPDGTKHTMYESIDPMVVIKNPRGETIAEGKMPFG